MVVDQEIVLLHGFIKKQQKTPKGELERAKKRERQYQQKIMSKKNDRGGDFRDFLKEQGILDEVEARALKQAISLQIDRLLKKLFRSAGRMPTALCSTITARRLQCLLNCHRSTREFQIYHFEVFRFLEGRGVIAWVLHGF